MASQSGTMRVLYSFPHKLGAGRICTTAWHQVAGIAAPIATGYIVAATHSFEGAFIAATVFLLIGIAGYIFLLGRMTPIPEPA